ncbi:MAG: ATP-binding cassette domain-containing protein [Fimbriimonadaceae bacterium]|nr:ATP-binding cassette domain-containing protein [Fimbriimonadaceae bacterium]
MVDVAGLSVSFDGKPVLRGLDLKVEAGEILVVMGSSGGGKTTLLRSVAGLVRPDKGEITVDGVSVLRDPDKAREKMGLVFQYAALFDYLDVSENILFGLRRRKRLSAAAAKEAVAEQLTQVGLEGAERMMPSELSGGMRKRVGLARALCMEPKVVLYDEPTSGLDPVTAFSIDQLIVDTRDRLGVTSVVVSHDVTSVLRVADRIAFLSAGEWAFVGTPSEFKSVKDGVVAELVAKSRAESLGIESFEARP